MNASVRWVLLPALVVGWLAAGPAAAQVIDKGEIFSSKAVDQADRRIKEIKQNSKKDLVIETFKEIPADLKKDYKESDKKAFFQHWALERARERKVAGVYVLICKNPSHFHIEVGNKTQTREFTLGDRDRLAVILKARTKPDETLERAVTFVDATMRENRAGSKSALRDNKPADQKKETNWMSWILHWAGGDPRHLAGHWCGSRPHRGRPRRLRRRWLRWRRLWWRWWRRRLLLVADGRYVRRRGRHVGVQPLLRRGR